MSAAADVNLADIPERIQSEVQRAMKRSIKGVEYFSTSGPALGSTPKDILHTRGTMNLYYYRPLADEVYRVPLLIVMATTNRGYIPERARDGRQHASAHATVGGLQNQHDPCVNKRPRATPPPQIGSIA
jgi:hypothetical protein